MEVQAVTIMTLDGNGRDLEPVTIVTGGSYQGWHGGTVKEIQEHPAAGEGDCWNWLVTYEDGSQVRHFRGGGSHPGVVRVDYAEGGAE